MNSMSALAKGLRLVSAEMCRQRTGLGGSWAGAGGCLTTAGFQVMTSCMGQKHAMWPVLLSA